MKTQLYSEKLISFFISALEHEVFVRRFQEPDQHNLILDVLEMAGQIAAYVRAGINYGVIYQATLKLAGYLIAYIESCSLWLNLPKTPVEIIAGFLNRFSLSDGEIREQLYLLASEAGYMMVEEDNDHFKSVDRITWHAVLICYRAFRQIYSPLFNPVPTP